MNKINVTAIDINRQGRQGLADAAIAPGNLCEQTSTGFKVHAGAGLENERLIALSNLARGADFTSAYATGETCQVFRALPGDEFYGTITAGATITALDDLVSAGNGSLAAGDDSEDDQELVAKALESVDNSAGLTIAYVKVRAY